MTKEQFFIGLAVCMSALSLYVVLENTAPQNVGPISSQPATNLLNSEINGLRATLQTQQQTLTDFQTEFNKLHSQFLYSQNQFSVGIFSPTDQGFQLIRSTYGNLLVSLVNTEKLGDGYKLTFNFGNPTSMTISGLKGKISWQPTTDYQKYMDDPNYMKEINQKTNSKEFQILSNLLPGAWNTISITIGPANEQTIGEIDISNLQSDQVRMRPIRLPN